MAQPADIINRAFNNAGVITDNETITSGMQTDAFARLNADIDTLSAEGLVVPNQVEQVFNLLAGVTGYTLGAGGTWATTGGLRALKVTSWRAYYLSVLHSGGRVLSLPEFGELARQEIGENTPIPKILGADTSYPNPNVRVFPPPSSTPGNVELGYLTPVTNFVTVNDTINLPQGWLNLLEWRLARLIWGKYPSQVRFQYINEMAETFKAALITGQAMSAPQPQPSAPKGQQ